MTHKKTGARRPCRSDRLAVLLGIVFPRELALIVTTLALLGLGRTAAVLAGIGRRITSTSLLCIL